MLNPTTSQILMTNKKNHFILCVTTQGMSNAIIDPFDLAKREGLKISNH